MTQIRPIRDEINSLVRAMLAEVVPATTGRPTP
jgi:hypothetical protein